MYSTDFLVQLFLSFLSAFQVIVQNSIMAQKREQEIKVKVWLLKSSQPLKFLVMKIAKDKPEPLQKMVGGYFEMKVVAKGNGTTYYVAMNETGKIDNLPVNENFAEYIPAFPYSVYGDVVFMAGRGEGDVSMDVDPDTLRALSFKYFQS